MFAVNWGDKVHAWPVGIDTDRWVPTPDKDIDVLVYEKIRCHPERDRAQVRDPILESLGKTGLKVARIAYGHYQEKDFEALLRRTRTMVFLCEHETQGIALQQALSCGIPVFAWDLGGVWQDTDYYPHRVVFSPVTSAPYWDDRCGMKFQDAAGLRRRIRCLLVSRVERRGSTRGPSSSRTSRSRRAPRRSSSWSKCSADAEPGLTIDRPRPAGVGRSLRSRWRRATMPGSLSSTSCSRRHA